MAFDATRLKKHHIQSAAKSIDSGTRKLNPSTVYEVIIDNKRYPPKEIIRVAYRLATGEDVGIIYGGEQVNKPLRDLGFDIIRKSHVWKLGCNWGKGAPSFYEFIKREKIVISESEFEFNVGDLIAVTEGFTVYAIAQVKRKMKSVTENASYEESFSELDITYDESVLYAEAQWYELQETEIFTYELRQGIRKINDTKILNTVVDLWENRNVKLSKFKFYNKRSNEPVSRDWEFPCFVLVHDSWDDFGFKTAHQLSFHKSPNQRIEIGHVKILEKNKTETILSPQFKSLNKSFCSLGQTLDYYKRLKSELPSDYKKILRALNDCAFHRNIRKEFEKISGFSDSLLRSSEAELTLNEAKAFIDGQAEKKAYDFSFSCRIGNAVTDHDVDFQFNSDEALPNRFFCIVGRNGTGKTKFISLLANKLTIDNEPGTFYPKRPHFSRVIATSFSYFDSFKTPKKEDVSYEFIGIKSKNEVLSTDETINIVWNALQKVFQDKKKKKLWLNCVKSALETDYLNFQIEELQHISTKQEFSLKTIEIFSSGQNIIFQFITRLIATIEKNSILIFDEPETHLHPNIAGRLLRTLDKILDDWDSFCVISTHSPIIVQEMPSKFIRIFNRLGNAPMIFPPSIECLGENLSIISNEIFQADQDKELYKTQLEDLMNNYSLSDIKEIFDGKLSLNASIYIQTLLKQNDQS